MLELCSPCLRFADECVFLSPPPQDDAFAMDGPGGEGDEEEEEEEELEQAELQRRRERQEREQWLREQVRLSRRMSAVPGRPTSHTQMVRVLMMHGVLSVCV